MANGREMLMANRGAMVGEVSGGNYISLTYTNTNKAGIGLGELSDGYEFATVDWGDGSVEQWYANPSASTMLRHEYSMYGNYNVIIDDSLKMIDLGRGWGEHDTKCLSDYDFSHATNLERFCLRHTSVTEVKPELNNLEWMEWAFESSNLTSLDSFMLNCPSKTTLVRGCFCNTLIDIVRVPNFVQSIVYRSLDIGSYAREIHIPSSVTYIDYEACRNNTNVSDIYFYGLNPANIKSNSFQGTGDNVVGMKTIHLKSDASHSYESIEAIQNIVNNGFVITYDL